MDEETSAFCIPNATAVVGQKALCELEKPYSLLHTIVPHVMVILYYYHVETLSRSTKSNDHGGQTRKLHAPVHLKLLHCSAVFIKFRQVLIARVHVSGSPHLP